MKLTERVFDRIDHVARRYARFNEGFAGFLKGAEYLSEASSPIKGLSFNSALDKNYFEVLFAGMTIRFCFFVAYGSDGVLTGRVAVVRVRPAFSDTADVIGSFSFNGQGVVDFDTSDGDDKPEISYNAAEIVLHFLDQALAKPLP